MPQMSSEERRVAILSMLERDASVQVGQLAEAFGVSRVTARADLSAFGDAADIPAWAQAEMQWANAEKLILGRDGKLLAPNVAATRAEMASILSGYAAA